MIGPGKMRDVAPGGVDSGSDSTNRATDSAKLFSAPLWPVVLVASPGPPLSTAGPARDIEQSEDTYAPRYTPPEACGALEWGRTCSLDSFDVHS
jgi:DNA-binding transcriptional LysR family regulator